MAVSYRFLSTWLVRAPREAVWEEIYDQRAWPQWWPGLERVEELDPGDELGIGAHSRLTWRARLPYSLVFEALAVAIEPPRVVEAELRGELAGTGRWRLFEDAGVTAVAYEMDVVTTRRWMNALARPARPVFAASHDAVMRAGGHGLARRLGVELLAGG